MIWASVVLLSWLTRRTRVGVGVEEAIAVAQRFELLGQHRLLGLAQRRTSHVILGHQADEQLDVVHVAVNLLQFLLQAARST